MAENDKRLFHFDRPEQNSGFLLWQVTMRWQRAMNRALTPLNLTHTQFVMLAALLWLARTQEEVTQADIAKNSQADRMMVSNIVRNLEKRGFVSRTDSKADTRAKSVAATPAGLALFRQAVAVVKATDEAFFGVVADGEDLNRKLEVLMKASD